MKWWKPLLLLIFLPSFSFAARVSGGGGGSSSGGGGSGYIDVQDEGSDLVKRSTINFIGGSVTCADNGGTQVTDCTFVASSGGLPLAPNDTNYIQNVESTGNLQSPAVIHIGSGTFEGPVNIIGKSSVSNLTLDDQSSGSPNTALFFKDFGKFKAYILRDNTGFSIYASTVQTGSAQQRMWFSDQNNGAIRVLSSTFGINGIDWTWPSVDGSDGQFLKTNGSRVLSFASASGGSSAGLGGPIAIGTGTYTNFTNSISSPAFAISLEGSQFRLSAIGSTTYIVIDTITSSGVMAISSMTNYVTQSSATLNYLTLSSATGTYFQKTSVLAAAQFPALNGDVTNSVGSLTMVVGDDSHNHTVASSTFAVTGGTFSVVSSTVIIGGSTNYWRIGQGGAGQFVAVNNGVLTAASPAGSGDAVLAATQTWSGQNTYVQTVFISTEIRSLKRIVWNDGTIQVSSPPAGGAGGTPAGPNYAVQISSNGAFGAAADFNVNPSSIVIGAVAPLFVNSFNVTGGSMTVTGTSGFTVTNSTFVVNSATNVIFQANGLNFLNYQTTSYYNTVNITTNTSNLINITGMQWQCAANETWAFTADLLMTGITGGTEFGINGPAVSTGTMSVFGNTSAVGTFSMNNVTALNTADTVAFVTSNTTPLMVRLTGTMQCNTTPGAVNLMWKSVTGGNTSTIVAGSSMVARRIQ